MKNFTFLGWLLGCVIVLFAISAPHSFASDGRLLRAEVFHDYLEGSIDQWLSGKGYVLQKDMRKRNVINFDISNEGLVIEAKSRAFALMQNEKVNLSEFSNIEIDWNVIKQPKGASYENGVRNEALMVIVFLGDERHPSGSALIPDSPYFIGIFLCSGNDQKNHPYTGKYFEKNGRYICVDDAESGKLITSRVDLLKAYRQFFDKEDGDNPGISGIAISLDTTKAEGGGQSAGVLREIRFYH